MFFLSGFFENNPGLIIPWLFALLIAIVLHEFAHGFVAWTLGDDTAERAGRLSLNPVKHLDLFGSIMLLLVGLGWAKPVPINPINIKKGKLGQFMVSFAGVFVNIILAIIAIVFLKAILSFGVFTEFNFLVKFLAFLVYINIALFVFNLLPIAPLDGYRMFELFAPKSFNSFAPFMEQWGFVLIIILVFIFPVVSVVINIAISLFSIIFNVPIYNLAFGNLI